MINHKYLTDLGLQPTEIMTNLCEPDEREPIWAKQRAVYGFDERETWSLHESFYQWLYERLTMYKELNCVDLSYHKFEYNGEVKTQGELIDKMIEYCKIAILNNNWDMDEENFNKVMEIGKIWAIVLPAMWW